MGEPACETGFATSRKGTIQIATIGGVSAVTLEPHHVYHRDENERPSFELEWKVLYETSDRARPVDFVTMNRPGD